MDKIFIRNLETETIIGTFDWERQISQKLYFDVEMATDVGKAASSDRLDDALDYKAISKYIQDFVAKSECQLIETLANQIATALTEEFNIGWLRLCLNKKGAIRGAQDVGVIVERGTQSTEP